MKETELYQPVKDFFERQGFEVKAEVGHCDVVAVRGSESPVVVELKLSLSLELLLQAVDRTRLADRVYVAVPESRVRVRLASRSARRSVERMFRMLGIGLITVGWRSTTDGRPAASRIEVFVEAAPYAPRRNLRHQRRLMREFHARRGDFNTGGTQRAERLTAYRQDALLCATFLHEHGASAPAAVKRATGIDRAGLLLYRNVYGWFEHPAAGSYHISETGLQALARYRDVVSELIAPRRVRD